MESPTGLFRQLKGSSGATYRAANFWTAQSDNFVQYLSADGKYYIKHDPTTGRVLFADAESKKFMGFMLDEDNLIQSNYDNLLENLKTIHGLPNSNRVVNIKGFQFVLADDKANVVLGKYRPNSTSGVTGEIGTDDVIEQLTVLKNYSFADKSFELRNGSVHVLNIPDGMYNPATFFDTYNKEILDLIVENSAEIKVTLISDPRKTNLLYELNNGVLTEYPSGFAKEIRYLRDRNIKTVYLKDGSAINLDDIGLNNINWSKWSY
jgi:hypothetical protein